MDELFGLPAHPLVVHGAVVLVPLAAIGVVLIAFWPAARAKLGLAVVAIALAGTVMAFLAAESGEALEDSVRETELVEEHAELGDSGLASAAAVLVGALGVVGLGMYERRRASSDPAEPATETSSSGPSNRSRQMAGLSIGVGVVAVVLASLGTFQIAKIGHSGAKATWETVEVDGDDDD
jgi:uncharacterized membrane protein